MAPVPRAHQPRHLCPCEADACGLGFVAVGVEALSLERLPGKRADGADGPEGLTRDGVHANAGVPSSSLKRFGRAFVKGRSHPRREDHGLGGHE